MITFVHLLINQIEKAHSPPLGALYLIGRLRQYGVSVEFKQFCHIKGSTLDPGALANFLLSSGPIVAVSTMINSLPLLCLALREVKQRAPERKIVVGGPGFLGLGREVLAVCPEIDVVALGEGEEIVVPLTRALTGRGSLRDVPGICFADGCDFICTDTPPRVRNLDELPWPDYGDVDVNAYKSVGVMAARGCPYDCTFCDVAPSWGRRNTRRSVDNVLQELKYLETELGVREIAFVDDLFVLNKRWLREFCSEKRRRGLSTSWRCNGHVNLLDADIVAMMADAGCHTVFFGIESGSNQILERIHKNFSAEKALDVVEVCLRHMRVSTNFMWGFPFETSSDLRATCAMRREVIAMGAQASLVMLAPLRQSPLYRDIAPKKLSPDVPNIFVADYYELIDSSRDEFLALLSSSPSVFSAFYHFDSPQIDERIEQVQLELCIERAWTHFVSEEPLWGRL